jgi:hypothetical protein
MGKITRETWTSAEARQMRKRATSANKVDFYFALWLCIPTRALDPPILSMSVGGCSTVSDDLALSGQSSDNDRVTSGQALDNDRAMIGQ